MTESIESPFIHFHIPKTAGTSLRAALVNFYGADNVAYRLSNGSLVRVADLRFDIERLDRARQLARRGGMLKPFSKIVRLIDHKHNSDMLSLEQLKPHGLAMAIGHFKWQDITEAASQLQRTTIIRDPLQRMWSHYGHWQEAKGSMWWHTGSIAYSSATSFETFALDPALADYQSKLMGDLPFSVIGATINIPVFLGRLGIEPQQRIPTLNPGVHTAPRAFDPGFLRDFTNLHAADYALYETALLTD